MSTALGLFLAIAPLAILPSVLVFVAVVGKWGYISAGSLSAAMFFPAAAYLIGYPSSAYGLAMVVVTIIFIRHRSNLTRLLKGEENKWRQKTT